MAVPSPGRDIRIVSAISTFVLNTLDLVTQIKCIIFFVYTLIFSVNFNLSSSIKLKRRLLHGLEPVL